jgi:hypothetical protein
MHMRRRGIALLLVSTFVVTVATTSASAVSHPMLKLFVAAGGRVNAGKGFTVTYNSSGVPSGTTVFLQHQVGTAHVWKSVAARRAPSGVIHAPGITIGKYLYRLFATVGKKPVSSAAVSLYSYGSVSLLTVCNALNNLGDVNNFGQSNAQCGSGTTQIGSGDYTYVASDTEYGDQYPTYGWFMKAPRSTCRSATLTFADNDQPNGTTYYVQMIQSKTGPESASTPPQTIGTFKPRLDGGSWILNISHTDSGGYTIVMNGHFSCYSISGI